MIDVPFIDQEYNLIYCSWGLENLNDGQVVYFLKQIRQTLTKHIKPGMCVFKESIVLDNDNHSGYDQERCTYHRTNDKYLQLF